MLRGTECVNDVDTANILSLCSGGAGLDLGIELALGSARTVCYVECEAFAIDYLATAMEAGCLAPAPVWTDLRTFDGKPWRGVVDCLTAGYPCQPFSKAGRRHGKEDPRYLWPHVARVVGEVEPTVCFFENVSGHLSLGFSEVAEDLEDLGYKIAAGLFSAEETGASHIRERLFILALANTHHTRTRRMLSIPPRARGLQLRPADRPTDAIRPQAASDYVASALANTDCTRFSDSKQHRFSAAAKQGETRATTGELRLPLFPPGPDEINAWQRVLDIDDTFAPAQSSFRLVADGVADVRADWLRLLGNGVVPLAAAYAFCSLWAALRAA